jgi:hypothetical protein
MSAALDWTARLFMDRGIPRLTLVDEDCGVVAEEGVGATGEFEEVNQVGIGPLWLHSSHGVSKRDALVKGGERPELDPSPQGVCAVTIDKPLNSVPIDTPILHNSTY